MQTAQGSRRATPGFHLALITSLAIGWVNFLTTTRWAHIEGSINGPKQPYFLVALVFTSALALWALRTAKTDAGPSARSTRLAALAGTGALAAAFFAWFPPGTWRQVPFLDDWPIRFHSALDMMRLIDDGSFVGWEWRFLGGYHSSSDATQGLGTVTYLPMKIFGPLLGFHIAHALLFAAVPCLVWIDLTLDPARDRRVTHLAVGFSALLATGYGYFLIRSGDTNSLGGVVMAMTALVGGHAARIGRRWGSWVLVVGLALTIYAHPGFFAYACLYLVLDAALQRDARSLGRAVVAGTAALIASLPLTYETFRYPDLFSFNNVVYAPPPVDWIEIARSFYYNVELTFLPHRWFNDYSGLAMVIAPLTIALAIKDRSRARFYAAAALVAIVLKWFLNVHTGYVFLRPVHMMPLWLSPVLAVVVVRHLSTPWLRGAFVATIALYVQIWAQPIPHVRDVRAFDGELTDRVAASPGALVLVENNPHRNMNADPGGTTERSRFGTHFEPMLADTTGRRLFSGGYSDGWQWNPWKGRVVAGGTFMGRSITATSHDDFIAELRRWGVVYLYTWSETTNAYLWNENRLAIVWRDDTWTGYRLLDADAREVNTNSGRGTLLDRTPFGAIVTLAGVRAGESVTVRTNFHPAWTADAHGTPISLGPNADGQLTFSSPCDGDCVVTLRYPRRRWLLPIAGLAVVVAGALLRRRQPDVAEPPRASSL
jgi:hypothetical protein